MKTKCECCGREIDKWKNQKRCSSCSVYCKDYIHQISLLKNQLRRLRRKFYGQNKGSERLRWK